MTVSEWIGSTEFWMLVIPMSVLFVAYSIFEKIDDRRKKK